MAQNRTCKREHNEVVKVTRIRLWNILWYVSWWPRDKYQWIVEAKPLFHYLWKRRTRSIVVIEIVEVTSYISHCFFSIRTSNQMLFWRGILMLYKKTNIWKPSCCHTRTSKKHPCDYYTKNNKRTRRNGINSSLGSYWRHL